MIPASPSASYLEEALVTTSIFSIASACNIFNASAVDANPESLPSTKMRTLLLPLKLILPSASTVTEGIFSKTSEAVAPWVLISAATLYTLLSI